MYQNSHYWYTSVTQLKKKKKSEVAHTLGENVIAVLACYLLKEAETLNYCCWLKEAYSQAWTKGPRCFNRNSLCVNQMSDPTEQLHLQPDLGKSQQPLSPATEQATCQMLTFVLSAPQTRDRPLRSLLESWLTKSSPELPVNPHRFFKTKIQRHRGWTTAKWERGYCLLSTGPGCSSLSAFLSPNCIKAAGVCAPSWPGGAKLLIYNS